MQHQIGRRGRTQERVTAQTWGQEAYVRAPEQGGYGNLPEALSPVTFFSSPVGEGNNGIHLTRLLHGEAELIAA